MVDFSPLAPHIVRPIPHLWNASARTPGREDNIQDDTIPPPPSFYTLEEPVLAHAYDFHESAFTSDRGGACCISIADPRSNNNSIDAPKKKLFLGISHVKTPHARRKLQGRLPPNQYVSRFIAFEREAPYRSVAVSGFFCLPGHPSVSQYSNITTSSRHENDGSGSNPLVPHAAATTSWTLVNRIMDCPVIHFVTGMTEKVDDPTKVIIAYGVADCTGWFVEVEKAEVVKLLFVGPG